MRRLLPATLAALALALLGASPASAAFGLKDLDTAFVGGEGGASASQAGSHPFAFTTSLSVNTTIKPEGEFPEGEVKNLVVAQIPGLVGSQKAVPRCSAADFNTRIEGRPQCPDSTAVGLIAVKLEFSAFPPNVEEFVHVPVYNLVPSPGEPAKLGFVALNVPITVDVELNPDPPHNLVATLSDVPQAILFYSSRLTIWGNPANPAHDTLRGNCLGEPVEPTPAPVSLGSCSAGVPEAPFLTLPRSCQGSLSTLFTADTWEAPGAFTEPQAAVTHDESVPPKPLGMTGCSSLVFGPAMDARPSTGSAESASGLEATIEVDDEGIDAPKGKAQSDIRKVEVTLPEGVTVNPSAAEGLSACTPAQLESAGLTVGGCPESSKLGSVEVESPLLGDPVDGSIYVAQPDDPATTAPGAENPFDSLLAVYIVLRDPLNGIFVAQAAEVQADARTGRLLTTVEEIPQLPFSRFTLRFREGPRAPLVTPPHCGTYAITAAMTPWAGGEAVESNPSFQIASGPAGGPCPAAGAPPFRPTFEAGTVNNSAGAYSPLNIRLTRGDGEQNLTRLDSVLPPGVVGKLVGVARCPDAGIAAAGAKTGRQELANPSCPAGSQVGRVLAGAGVGSALTYVPGKVYLAGPFAGAPLSIVAIVPAVAGPFDVGTVVTREALSLDPATAEVRVDGAAAGPIPQILEGVPLRLRDLRIYVDRPNFTLNATSCEEKFAGATLFGSAADVFSPADDAPVALTARYQAADCAVLRFGPKLSLALKGGTRRSGHPALHSTVTYPYPSGPGYANIGRAVVFLPGTEFIDNAHINNPCTRVQFDANACPRSSILGRARAITPLLDQPLEGPVYFRANGGERPLPDIVADLRGEVHIVLVGHVDSVGRANPRIRTTFATVPDAAVSRFTLDLFGGRRGLLVNSANLCARPLRAGVRLIAHNGRALDTSPAVKTSCGRQQRSSRKKQRRRGR